MKKILSAILTIVFILTVISPLSAYYLGDLNKNGKIEMSEAVEILQCVAKVKELTYKQSILADINEDGKITMSDAVMMLQYASNLTSDYREMSEWKQDEFILSTFMALDGSADIEKYKDILTKTKDAGFNLVENAWLSYDAAKAAAVAAQEVNIDILIQNLGKFSGFQGAILDDCTVEDIVNSIEEFKNNKNVIGYYIWDEPETEQFDRLNNLIQTFDEYSDNKLLFSCILPSYGRYTWKGNASGDYKYNEYVDMYLEKVNPQVLSFDYYSYMSISGSLEKSDIWKDVGYMRKKSIETGKPLWIYIQAVELATKQLGFITKDHIKAQMNNLLCYGVDGISYYNSDMAVVNSSNGEKSLIYDDLKAVNEEVKSLGNFLMMKNSDYVFHSGITNEEIIKSYFADMPEDSELLKSINARAVTAGMFSDDTENKYLLIANKRHGGTTKGYVELKQNKDVYILNTITNEKSLVGVNIDKFEFKLEAGGAELYILN